MSTRSSRRPILALATGALVAASFGVGYAVARRAPVSSERPIPHDGRDEREATTAPMPPRAEEGARVDAPRTEGGPAWAPTASGSIPTVGSMFRNRFSVAESPLDGMEAVLLSPRDDECLDDCPLALRMVRGAAGAKAVGSVAGSLAPNLRAIADAPGIPPKLAEWIRGAAGMFDRHAGRTLEQEERDPLRALFIGMPRPEVAASTWSVGLALYDVPDSHFDRGAPDETRVGGRVLLSRLETGGGDTPYRLLSGALEVDPPRTVGRPRPFPEGNDALATVFGSLWGHFQGLPTELGGLYLAQDGTVYAFDANLALYRLAADPRLAKALRVVLLRA